MTTDILAVEADPVLRGIWSPTEGIRIERMLWTHVLGFHAAAGVAPEESWGKNLLAVYEGVDGTTLRRIEARERVTRHDLKARLEIFAEDCGHEHNHLGMTSADVVDNVALIRIQRSLDWLARTRLPSLASSVARLPFRGIKGAVGTQQDQLDLLGDEELCVALDQTIAKAFDFDPARILTSVGQVYPRSIDAGIAADLLSAVRSHNRGVAGSHADPEAVGYEAILVGFTHMLTSMGGQWNEGDVSTSVTRRVALPGMLYAAELATRPVPVQDGT